MMRITLGRRCSAGGLGVRFAAVMIGCGMLLCAAARVDAQVTVSVDPGATWLGFMNVSELPANGGGYVFGSGWGTADLVATFAGPVLTLAPNSVNDVSTFWYQGGGGPGAPGNKTMEANMYVEETGPLSGQLVTFKGSVLANSLVDPYTSVAFIKDFAPDYSSNTTVTVPLTPGAFSVSLATNGAAGRHVQYGFQTVGPNVWITDAASKGSVQVVGVPEPAALTLLGIAAGGLLARRRRRG
jgi:hypothetical protein